MGGGVYPERAPGVRMEEGTARPRQPQRGYWDRDRSSSLQKNDFPIFLLRARDDADVVDPCWGARAG